MGVVLHLLTNLLLLCLSHTFIVPYCKKKHLMSRTAVYEHDDISFYPHTHQCIVLVCYDLEF